ncbi:MAG TPA: hypothetical protein PKC40_13005, partial [Saprospiraceae bacterium]|nr:hypothetical protein [Saprospiraceae bacterium]
TLTESIYPLKVNEYLAAGKPVVSTSFSDDIRDFREVVYLADSEAAFLDLLDRAILENDAKKTEARAAVAAKNTWAARVQYFWNLVNKHLGKKSERMFERV